MPSVSTGALLGLGVRTPGLEPRPCHSVAVGVGIGHLTGVLHGNTLMFSLTIEFLNLFQGNCNKNPKLWPHYLHSCSRILGLSPPHTLFLLPLLEGRPGPPPPASPGKPPLGHQASQSCSLLPHSHVYTVLTPPSLMPLGCQQEPHDLSPCPWWHPPHDCHRRLSKAQMSGFGLLQQTL